MTTIVASPPTLQSLPHISWNGPSASGTYTAMTDQDVSRLYMPSKRVITRSSSTSSLASNASTASTSSTSTVTPTTETPHNLNGDIVVPTKKKQRGGFWPASKAEATSSVSNARANGAVQPAGNNSMQIGQKGQIPAGTSENGAAVTNGAVSRPQSSALLVLLPMNSTFDRKQISVPMAPDPPQKIGRQTNNKTIPKQDNGFFDSKVLSRQHAEIWADPNGRIWIKDVKSSNGTFVNGTRLSPENRESEPTELRQHDSLELGIDIVSEDQKTIVHHKVSAKVEFAGFPGKSGNALDLLNFGELDPSHGNTLLNSPMSTPMAHSRSQQGRPMGGRASVPSSVTSGNANSAAQRQMNYWGTPLNVEQLVRQVGLEMRAAKQQAQDLEQAKTFLTSILPSDGGPPRLPPNLKDSPQSKANGRVKAPRPEHSGRFTFTDPPAPPPSQPLPEKPDSAKAASPNPASMAGLLKRETTAKPLTNGISPAPGAAQSSQILSLLESLKDAQKQIESQGSKVKQLEDMLREERQARAAAEDKLKKLEQLHSSKPVVVDDVPETAVEASEDESVEPQAASDPSVEVELQQRIDLMLSEMQAMKQTLEQTTQRADHAETERSSLAEMIEKYRKERDDSERQHEKATKTIQSPEQAEPATEQTHNDSTIKDTRQANGYIKGPRIPEDLQHAVTTVLRHQQNGEDVPAQYAPYVSMIGVVLIGVGIMAYLNQWQKVDK